MTKKIIIAGGGFGGITAALDLARTVGKREDIDIALISDKAHFEYSPALYRIIGENDPTLVCIALSEIFQNKRVTLVMDRIIGGSLANNSLRGASGVEYSFDYAILAFGSETEYFELPGLREFSFGIKTVAEAARLKAHLRQTLATCRVNSKEENVCNGHIIVVGGGPTGIELAGELMEFTKKLSEELQFDHSLITIDVIDSASRILPSLPQSLARRVELQLRKMGINIYTNRPIMGEDLISVYLPDMKMKTKTVVWTAGISINPTYRSIEGIALGPKKRVTVDQFLHPSGHTNVFVIGDAADTIYQGMAQTAIYDAHYVANTIHCSMTGTPALPYRPRRTAHIVPAGKWWAAAIIGPIRFYGLAASVLRRLVDVRFLLSILPVGKVYKILTNKCDCVEPVTK